jgi:1-deoxy-D-xylulose-5-phosphate reductoisomerase
MKRISLLGATGSIGKSCQDVLRIYPHEMQLHSCCCQTRWQEMAAVCQEFKPAFAVICDTRLRETYDASQFPRETKVLFGADAIADLASHPDVDIVVSAIVGAAGLRGSYEAVRAGKTLAIANKETMVIAGSIIMARALETGTKLLPVDSEHSAIFQCLNSGKSNEVERIILTASGGPFREHPKEKFCDITPAQALDHPTWNMGPKITIDSATMMNKALEVIEARWLFNLLPGQIEVAIHPQSIIHSMVEFQDGSIIAQMSPPDMRLPIQYALTYPDRKPGVAKRMDWTRSFHLDLIPPDLEKFPCLALGFEVTKSGGITGAVLNAANEIAVDRFLKSEIPFHHIERLCRDVLNHSHQNNQPTLDELIKADSWTRQEAISWKL